MSLKAKIEAVIYASEEPVTLTQLTSLLSHEAQAELDQLDSQQNSAQPSLSLNETELDLEAAAETDPTLNPDAEEFGAPAEQGSEASPGPSAPESSPADASKADNSAKEKSRRLRDHFRSILDSLIADYASESNNRGIEIREIAGGYRFATKPEYHDAVRGFVKSLKPPLKLTLQALETLAVVAYKQPVTAPEISEIRGVDTSGVLGSLMARKLIATAGRKQVIGRPILYKTSKEFLLRFGLKDLNELPSIEEFEKMAGELADSDSDAEPLLEEFSMPAPHLQADGSPAAAENPLDVEVEDALEDNPLRDDVDDIEPARTEHGQQTGQEQE